MILYKYYPCDLNTFKSLAVRGLWCHLPDKMNDPVECLSPINRTFSLEEINNAKEYINKIDNPQEIIKKIQSFNNEDFVSYINKTRYEAIQKYAFCSLSENPLDMLMWSHYANSHNGIVIGIEFDDNELMDHHFQKVEYIDVLPQYNIKKLIDFMQMSKDELPDSSPLLDYFLKDISVKLKLWGGEQEWRIWRSFPTYYHYNINKIKEIYFGLKCGCEVKALILNILGAELPDDFIYYEVELKLDPIRLSI